MTYAHIGATSIERLLTTRTVQKMKCATYKLEFEQQTGNCFNGYVLYINQQALYYEILKKKIKFY